MKRGARDVPAASFDNRPDPSHCGVLFPLAGDRPDSISTYNEAWTTADGATLDIAFKAFGADVSTKAELRQEREVLIKIQLPGGADYRLRPLRGQPGLHWCLEGDRR
jgi:hypothetical protein